METKVCKKCGEQISKKAKICPHCRSKQKKIPTFIVVLIIIIGIIAIVSTTASNIEEEKANFTYEVTNEYTDIIGTHYIEGTVRNGNEKKYSYVQIEFVCYDKDGNNLGTALDNTNNLGANETWKFKALLLSTVDAEVDHCDFEEITNW